MLTEVTDRGFLFSFQKGADFFFGTLQRITVKQNISFKPNKVTGLKKISDDTLRFFTHFTDHLFGSRGRKGFGQIFFFNLLFQLLHLGFQSGRMSLQPDTVPIHHQDTPFMHTGYHGIEEEFVHRLFDLRPEITSGHKSTQGVFLMKNRYQSDQLLFQGVMVDAAHPAFS